MNINIYTSVALTGPGPGKLSEKARANSRPGAGTPGDAIEPDTFEVQSSQGDQIENPSDALVPVADASAAHEEVVFLKNAMLALPALVLRGQANLVRQSVAQLLR